MNALQYLFAGFAVFWAGLFVYLLILQARVRSLQREIEQLEERLEESDAAPATASTSRPPAEQSATGA
jgi:CcmD family protein